MNISDVSMKNMVDSANIKSIKRMLGPSKLNVPDKELSLERQRRNESKIKHQTELREIESFESKIQIDKDKLNSGTNVFSSIRLRRSAFR